MYGRGLSYSDISEHVQEMYSISISKAAINAITDKIIATVEAWQGDSPIWPSSSSQLKNDL